MSYMLLFLTAPISLIFLLLNNIDLLLKIVLFTLAIKILYGYIKNSIERRDILNIIKYNNRVYFTISDDTLFHIDILSKDIFDEDALNSIEKKVSAIKEDIYKIEFINFYDERLFNILNGLIDTKK